MAEKILLDIAANILSSLGSYAIQQIGLAWGVKEELRKMKNNVSTIKNILLDAQERQMSNLAVKEWLQRLKLILYDADDLLDEVATETKIRQGESLVKKVNYFFTSSNPLVFSYVVGRKFKDVGKRLDEIVSQMNDFQFVVRLVERPIETIRREETSSIMNTPTMIVGREDDKNNLVSLLLSSHYEENVPIIPIVGMGGLGKTTLLQLVYNDNRIENHFTKRLWVCISTNFDIKTILIKILQVGGASVDSSSINGGLDQLQNRVRDMFGDSNFLLVLDDVWNDDRVKWKTLEDFFITLPRGSRIVVTTRSDMVASIVKTTTVESYKLKGLPDNQCLDILVKWAFKEGDERRHPNLVNIGKEIVQKCGGVPLAARTLGALLFLKANRELDWLSVRDSEMWALVQAENDILPILRLSYDQMPSYLKQCFAYCSLFKKDEVIDGKKLIYAWMAHGFVQCSHRREELEDTGEGYIFELLRRSFLEPDDREFIHGQPGRKKLYKMHDLVHDLAQYVAGNECLSVRGDIQETIPDTVRHVSFDGHMRKKFPRPFTEAKKWRTIHIHGRKYGRLTYGSSEPEIGSSGCLRVLEGCYLASNLYMPKKIGKLKLLRYLSIGGVEELPKSFCNLLNLQYLDLSQSNMVKLPKDFGKLINLRFLSFSTVLTCLPKEEIGGLSSLRTLIICQSSNLRSLGEGIEHLSCLRELVLDGCSELVSLPAGFRHLTSLERLEINSCDCFDFSNDDFMGLISFKKLQVYRLPRLVNLPEGIQDTAASLTHLEILECRRFTSPSEFILPSLLSLQSLRICGCPEVRSLPEGMQHLTNLQYLEISECNLLTSSYEEGGEDWQKVAHIPSIELFKPWDYYFAFEELRDEYDSGVKAISGCGCFGEMEGW